MVFEFRNTQFLYGCYRTFITTHLKNCRWYINLTIFSSFFSLSSFSYVAISNAFVLFSSIYGNFFSFFFEKLFLFIKFIIINAPFGTFKPKGLTLLIFEPESPPVLKSSFSRTNAKGRNDWPDYTNGANCFNVLNS